jgi:predicted SnoaL-like aldol condensation-catalyzing enzyme
MTGSPLPAGGEPADRLDANKRAVRRLYEELFTGGQLDLAEELMTKGYLNHDPPPGTGHTRGDVKAAAAGLRQRLAGFAARIERIAAEGGLVAVRGTLTGTDASGARTELRLSWFFRCRDGRIAERWG